MSETKKNKLILFWESLTKETMDAIKASRAFKSLQRQAEIDVAKAQENLENAKTELDKSKADAKENSKFQPIVESFMKVRVAQKKFDDAVEVYRDLFEETPKLL